MVWLEPGGDKDSGTCSGTCRMKARKVWSGAPVGLGIAFQDLPCPELSQEPGLWSLESEKWKLCCLASTCCVLPIIFGSTR